MTDIDKVGGRYIFNSSILTIFMGAAAFIVAFAWNQAAKTLFEYCHSEAQELHAMILYAVTVTIGAILFCFLLKYFLIGEKY